MKRDSDIKKREKELEALKKEATLKKMLELEARNQEAQEEVQRKLNLYEMKRALNEQIKTASHHKRANKTAESIQRIVEGKNQASRYPLQQHNVASLIMEMEPRFAALGKFFTSLQWQLAQEYLSESASQLYWSAWAPSTTPNVNLDKPITLPDLKYFVDVTDKGELKADFVPAYIKNFIVYRDENGKITEDADKALIFQQAFQKGVEEWLAERGYFVQKTGESFRIYSKNELGKPGPDGKYILDSEKLRNVCELADCDYDDVLETHIPRPNTRTITGTPLHMETAEFNRIKDETLPGSKPLGEFLEDYFEGLVHENTPRAGLGM